MLYKYACGARIITDWECLDFDNAEFGTLNPDWHTYHFIEMVWLDLTEEDKKEGAPEYVVVECKRIDPSQFTDDDKIALCDSFGRDLDLVDGAELAKMWFEENCQTDAYAIYACATEKEALKYIAQKVWNGMSVD